MVAPAGVLVLLLRLAAFIFGPRLLSCLFVCLFVARVDWHAAWRLTPASSLKMTHA